MEPLALNRTLSYDGCYGYAVSYFLTRLRFSFAYIYVATASFLLNQELSYCALSSLAKQLCLPVVGKAFFDPAYYIDDSWELMGIALSIAESGINLIV